MNRSNEQEVTPAGSQRRLVNGAPLQKRNRSGWPKATREDYIREITRMVSEIRSTKTLIGIYSFVRVKYGYDMEARIGAQE